MVEPAGVRSKKDNGAPTTAANIASWIEDAVVNARRPSAVAGSARRRFHTGNQVAQ